MRKATAAVVAGEAAEARAKAAEAARAQVWGRAGAGIRGQEQVLRGKGAIGQIQDTDVQN